MIFIDFFLIRRLRRNLQDTSCFFFSGPAPLSSSNSSWAWVPRECAIFSSRRRRRPRAYGWDNVWKFLWHFCSILCFFSMRRSRKRWRFHEILNGFKSKNNNRKEFPPFLTYGMMGSLFWSKSGVFASGSILGVMNCEATPQHGGNIMELTNWSWLP